MENNVLATEAENIILTLSINKRDLTLDTSDDAIEKVCTRDGLPTVKHGQKVKLICLCGCKGSEDVTVIGVGLIDEFSPCSNPERKGKNSLWISKEIGGNVAVIIPGNTTIEVEEAEVKETLN